MPSFIKIPWEHLKSATAARALLPKLSSVAARALLYIAGDYWQGMKAWAGTHIPDDVPNRAQILQELQRSFTPQPIIEECTERFVAGLLAQEPATEFVLARALKDQEEPTSEEVGTLDETNAALTTFWDRTKGQELSQDFLGYLAATGRASMRFFVPAGLLDKTEDGLRARAGDWLEMLDQIYLAVPHPDKAGVVLDPSTMRRVSIVVFSEQPLYNFASDESSESSSLAQTPVGGSAVSVGARVEISYLDTEGNTVIRILEGEKVIENGEEVQKTGGELYLDEARMPPLITDAVQRLTNALNVVYTMLLYNSNLAGFRERNYINLQKPQKEEPDATQPKGYRLEDDNLVVGPTSANFLSGIVYKDKEGNEQLATGSIVITDPVDPAPLIAAKDEFETAIYKACDQLHAKMNGNSQLSGVSRVQARASFILRLKKAKPKLEGVLRTRLRGAFILAAFLAGDEERVKKFSGLRAQVDCHINAGPMSPEERDEVVKEYKAGLISFETALILLGFEDSGGELQKMVATGTMSLDVLAQRSAVLHALQAAGVDLKTAALLAGFNETQVNQMKVAPIPPMPVETIVAKASP